MPKIRHERIRPIKPLSIPLRLGSGSLFFRALFGGHVAGFRFAVGDVEKRLAQLDTRARFSVIIRLHNSTHESAATRGPVKTFLKSRDEEMFR